MLVKMNAQVFTAFSEHLKKTAMGFINDFTTIYKKNGNDIHLTFIS